MVPFFHYLLLVSMKNVFSTKFDTPYGGYVEPEVFMGQYRSVYNKIIDLWETNIVNGKEEEISEKRIHKNHKTFEI